VVADAFGPDRLVFGSNWPVCTMAATYSQVVDATQHLLRERVGANAMRQIMETNGVCFYGLAGN